MRLIDADELIKILEEYENDEGSKAIYGEENLSLILGDCKIEIERLPTAYDVDKVVERLEILSDRAYDKIMEQEGSEQYWDGFGDGIDEAIKILKSGGIE